MCGIIGLIGKYNNNIGFTLIEGLLHLQHRGQDGVGLCDDKFTIKAKGLVKNIMNDSNIKNLNGNIGIGHVRYSTTGIHNEESLQPIESNYNINSINYSIKLSHNGNITNTEYISNIINKKCCSDTQYIIELFIHKLNFIISNKNTQLTNDIIFEVGNYLIDVLKGSFNLLILIKNFGLVVIRDKYGIRPLVYGNNKTDYIIASETCVLDNLNFELIRDVKPGEIIIFKENNYPSFNTTSSKSILHSCLFEYIYFARPDSIINGINVYNSRYNLGRILGKKIKENKIYHNVDAIIPIPDSSLPFAIGVSDVMNIPLSISIVKNNYVDRTFIMENTGVINKSIKRKLNLIKQDFSGKNIIFVDDSIVRGNTTKYVALKAKQSGAKDIHFVSGSPKVCYSNLYGIYIPTQEELIGYSRSEENIADIIGATSVIYNDLQDVIECLQKMNTNKKFNFEVSMFNNIHPN